MATIIICTGFTSEKISLTALRNAFSSYTSDAESRKALSNCIQRFFPYPQYFLEIYQIRYIGQIPNIQQRNYKHVEKKQRTTGMQQTTWIPLEEAAGGESPGDPLDGQHGAVARHEGLVAGELDEGRLDASLAEQLEDLGVGRIADGGLALELVRLDPVAGRYAVLALQVAELSVVRELVHLLRLALDQELA